jgi:hypothetical protein
MVDGLWREPTIDDRQKGRFRRTGLLENLYQRKARLLRLLLFLLTDTNLKLLLLGVLKGLVVVPRNRIGKVRVHIDFLRQNCHQRKGIIASRTKRTESLHVGDRHTLSA